MLKIRVQKFLSEAGIASRRKAEEFIKSGQVFINGRKAKLGDKVDVEVDEIKVYGKIVKPTTEKIYIMLNKPKGLMVTKSDPHGRKTVFGLLPKATAQKVWNVGRLDYDTEGLLLFTNDGELTQALAHPKYEHDKEYEVVTYEAPTDMQMDKLRHGVEISTGPTAEAKVKIKSGKIFLTIHEGKKHQVRRMLEAVGLSVTNLKRVRMNKLELPNIKPGEFVYVKKTDII